MDQFVGFCVKHLHLEPTVEHVMEPMLVCKFWGFMMAKGMAMSTFKKQAGHLKDAITYIGQGHIIEGKTWSKKNEKQLIRWYTNLTSKLSAQIRVANQMKPQAANGDISLWEIWEVVKEEREELLKELEVSGGGSSPCCVGCAKEACIYQSYLCLPCLTCLPNSHQVAPTFL